VAAVPVLLPSGFGGCLVTALPGAADEETLQLLTVGATTVALVLASERAVAEAELRLRGELVHALLSGSVEEQAMRRRARAVGIDLDAVSVVVVCDSAGGDQREAARLVNQLAGEFRGWSAEHADQLVLLLPRTSPAAVSAWVRRLAGPDPVPGVFAVAGCDGGVLPVREAYVGARQTAAVVLALGRTSDCVDSTELGPYRALFSATGRGELGSFVDHTIGPLLAHDAEHGRDLARTLRVYLDQARHHARTCALLHIHANTLYQRLDRVTELLGPTWREPGAAFDLQLALRLQALRTVIVAGPTEDGLR